MKDRKYSYNVSELIDLASNLQIKETKFSKQKKYSAELKKLSKDLDQILKPKKILLSANLIQKILFVGFSNLFVWESKDEMLKYKSKYSKLLNKSLEINVIRNEIFNSLMIDFKEYDATRKRFTKLRNKNKNWIKFISKSISNSK